MRQNPSSRRPSRPQLIALGVTALAGAAAARLLHERQSKPDISNLMSQTVHRVNDRGTELANAASNSIRPMTEAIRRDASMQAVIALAATTILTGGVLGYLAHRHKLIRQRTTHKRLGSMSAEEVLEAHTVAELRKQAAEQDIAGRSSMNKQELVESLTKCSE